MHQWNQNQIPILQLGPDFYDAVKPALFLEQKLRYWNDSIKMTLEKSRLWDFKPLPQNLNSPLALRYHGHQFQNYNPNLGDGRGFLYAQLNIQNQWYDLGTKGSGQTPYSRRGDGRLTLKGAVREALATEMLESLNVTTSKTLAFFETGENLERSDEPSPTRSAVLTRFSKGHIRFGTFQRLAYYKQIENIKKLTSYSLAFYFAEEFKNLDLADENLLAARFFQSVVKAHADLVAQVMMAGFVHGVLNTDNMNVSGELFDFGPYRFLPQYDPLFTAAYFDQEGLYCYGRQPAAFMWALHQLGQSLLMAYPDLPTAEILETFSTEFNEKIHYYFLKKLNLKSLGIDQDQQLLSLFFTLLDAGKLYFEKTFFDFQSKKIFTNLSCFADYEKIGKPFTDFVKLFEQFEIESETMQNKKYNSLSAPCTLLIDEIEAIWKPIAEHDDWSLFHNKLQSIRNIRA
jgi:uncharacterized protein YdiU (UPF0061 family)